MTYDSDGSVVVHDLDLESVAVFPDEAEAPLIINPNAVLPFAIAAQCFQPISWRSHQVAEFHRAIQLPELPARHVLNCTEPPTRAPLMK